MTTWTQRDRRGTPPRCGVRARAAGLRAFHRKAATATANDATRAASAVRASGAAPGCARLKSAADRSSTAWTRVGSAFGRDVDDDAAGEHLVQADEPHRRARGGAPVGRRRDDALGDASHPAGHEQERGGQHDDQQRLQARRHRRPPGAQGGATHLAQRQDGAEAEGARGAAGDRVRVHQAQRARDADPQLRHDRAGVQHARRAVQREQDGAGERAHRGQLGADDRGARNRQRAEDRLVARVEGEAVPGDHRDQRQQDHRHADEQERVVDGADRVQGRHRERRQDEPRAAQHRQEGADREQRRQAQRGAAVRVRLRRQQVVVEEPRDEVPRQQPPRCRRRPGRRRVSHAPPRRRSIAPCARDPRGGPARRRRPRASCAIAAPAARSPSRRRRPCRGGAR